MKLVIRATKLNTRVWVEGDSNVQPVDCSTLHGAIGKLVMKHPKLFNIQEIKAYGKPGKSS